MLDREEDICNILGQYFSSIHTHRWVGELPDMNEQYETDHRNIIITRENIRK